MKHSDARTPEEIANEFEATWGIRPTSARPSPRSSVERLAAVVDMPVEQVRGALVGIAKRNKLERLKEKARLIEDGEVAIMPSGEIVAAGTPGSILESEWKRRAMERGKIAKELLIERDAERDLADKLADAVADLRTRLAAMGQGGPAGKDALELWQETRTIHSHLNSQTP